MSFRRSLTLAAVAALAGIVPAQCEFNVHPVTPVDASGLPLPTSSVNGTLYAESADGRVYLALAPTTPSGIYVYQVVDIEVTEILSRELLVDRAILVENVGGVIRMTRISANPALPAFGRGLGGVGDSIPLTMLRAPAATSTPCTFKAWVGDWYENWNGNPIGELHGIRGGINPATNACAIASFHAFRIGNGTAATLSGDVFVDADRDGVRDPSEPGAAGRSVRIVGGTIDRTTTTDSEGRYRFVDVPAGSYTVSITGGGATTPVSVPVTICPCASKDGPDFGVAPTLFCANARTPGFWASPNGLARIHCGGYLADLAALQVVDGRGDRFTTNRLDTFRSWLLGARATNMAYMLSAHLTAMHFNLRAGFVSPDNFVDDPELGVVRIQDLVAHAVLSLATDPYTPTGHPQRAHQERLKNALARANENQTWVTTSTIERYCGCGSRLLRLFRFLFRC